MVKIIHKLPLVLNKDNNNELAEYRGIFILFKGHIYSKPGSHISLLLDRWTYVLFPHIWVKPKSLLSTLTWQTSATFNMKTLHELCISNGIYPLYIKTFLLLRISLLKRFIYRRVKTVYILHGTKIPITLTKN